MTDSYKALSKFVMNEVAQRKQQAPPATDQSGPRLLGMFVDVCLMNVDQPRSYLADMLDLEPELVDALLDGTLPASEIDEYLLVDLARAIRRDPETLRALLQVGVAAKARSNSQS